MPGQSSLTCFIYLLCVGTLSTCLFTACSTCGNEGGNEAPPQTVEIDTTGSEAFAIQLPAEDRNDESLRRDVQPHVGTPDPGLFEIEPRSGEWNGYRGANDRQGVRQAPAIQTPEIAWSTQVGIMGYANNIIISGDRLYVTSQGNDHNDPDELDGVVALDRTNGNILWRRHTDDDANGIAMYDNTLYAVTDSGKIYLFDSEGVQLAVHDLQCSFSQAPLVTEDYITIMRDGRPARLYRENGVAERMLDRCRRSERGAVSELDGVQYATSTVDRLRAYEQGIRQWSIEFPWQRLRRPDAYTPPLLTAGMVVQVYPNWPFFDEGPDEVPHTRPAVVALWQDNGQIAWEIDIEGPGLGELQDGSGDRHLRNMAWVNNGRVFVTPNTRGEISVYDVLTAEKIGAVELPDCRRRQFPSIVGTPDVGYLARHDGVLYQFGVQSLTTNWALSLGSHGLSGNPVTHAPVVEGCSAQPRDGTGLFSTPSIADDGTVYVGSGEGWIYAIRESAGTH